MVSAWWLGLLMGPDWAQPKEATWDPLPVGSQPAGGAKGVGYIVCWVAAKSRDLGDLIPFCSRWTDG